MPVYPFQLASTSGMSVCVPFIKQMTVNFSYRFGTLLIMALLLFMIALNLKFIVLHTALMEPYLVGQILLT